MFTLDNMFDACVIYAGQTASQLVLSASEPPRPQPGDSAAWPGPYSACLRAQGAPRHAQEHGAGPGPPIYTQYHSLGPPRGLGRRRDSHI